MESVSMILRTLAEIAVVLTILAGFVRENKFLRVERKAFRFLRTLRRKAKEAHKRELEQELLRAQYAGEYETERRSKAADKEPEEPKRKNRHSRVA